MTRFLILFFSSFKSEVFVVSDEISAGRYFKIPHFCFEDDRFFLFFLFILFYFIIIITIIIIYHFICHFPLVSFVSHHFPLFNFCFTIIDHSVSRWAFYGFYTFIVQPYFSLFALTLTTFFWNARSLMKFLRKGLKLNPRWWVFCFQDPFKETTFLSSHRVLHLEKWGIGFHGTQLLLLNSHYHFNG